MSSYINGHPVDDIVLEGITSLFNDQLPTNKYKYRDIAQEAILNPAGRSKMIQKLYADIISKSNIDYGKIPLCKGNLTAYEYYDNITQSIEALESLLEGHNVDELKLIKDLHNMIITCRGDFEFGFRFDIEFIKLTFNTMTITLHELINLCIVSYVDYLKEIKQVDYQFKTFKRSDRLVIKSTKDFLKSYEKGEWTKLMLHFKKNSSNFIGTVLTATAALPTGAVVAGGVILGVVAILFSIRTLIYLYYSSAMKINQYIKIQSEFLKVSIENSSDQNSTSLEKQRKMLYNLESISTLIETKILKTEKEAMKELKESNVTNFSPQELRDTSDSTGIQLL